MPRSFSLSCHQNLTPFLNVFRVDGQFRLVKGTFSIVTEVVRTGANVGWARNLVEVPDIDVRLENLAFSVSMMGSVDISRPDNNKVDREA